MISALALVAQMPVSAQVPVIISEPEYLALPIGSSASFFVHASSATPESFQWFRDTQQLAGATSSSVTLPNITFSQAGNYFVVVSNSFGSVTSAPASLVVLPITPGMVDPMFNVGFGPNGVVRAVRPGPDGRIYIGGEFSSVNGTNRARLARLNANGSLDDAFTAGVSNGFNFASVYALAVQTNQQVIVGGSYSHANGTPRKNLARFNTNGTLDATLDAGLGSSASIWAIALQSDGKILIGGDFTSVQGNLITNLARLHSNGTLDYTFTAVGGINGSVRAIVLQPDGQVVVGGAFTIVNGQGRGRVARLTSSGAVDPGFGTGSGADSWVNALALQPDGKIILGGSFNYVNAVYTPYLARLETNGVLDPTPFGLSPLANGPVTSLSLQPNGKLIVGGGFNIIGGQLHPYFTRLKSDGTSDESFYENADANAWVETTALDQSGAILIGGAFTAVNGQSRPYVARLIGGEPLPFAPIFTQQPVRQQTMGEGANTELSGKAIGFPAITYQWRFNGTNLPGANLSFLELDNVRLVQAGNYELIASNSVGNATSRVSVVTISPARIGPGAVDISFYSGTGPNGDVRTIAVQPDGKAIIGGWFSHVDDVYQPYFARLNVDGSLDPDFSPSLDSIVTRVGISPSGTIGVSGYFYNTDGVPNPAFALYGTNGSVIPTFSSSIVPGGVVQSFAFQSNSQVIVAGYFIATNSTPDFGRTNLARLNLDGTVDAAFNSGPEYYDISSVAIDTNRKILIGGGFTTIQGQARGRIARLNYYGDLDPTFNPGSGANGRVTSVAIQPDGKILLAGEFRAFNGVPRHQIARLHPNGTLDLSFEPGRGADAAISALCLQSDGKILIGGGFSFVNFRTRFGIARLNRDGSLDLTFDPGAGANGDVNSIVELSGGKLLVGGAFLSFDNLPRPHIARLQSGNPPPFAPVIASQSENQTVQAGEDVTLFVEASGLPEPTYQWQFFGTNLPGATTWTLRLHNVRSFAAGNYSVIVSNSLNSLICLPITLTVVAPSRAGGSPDISFYTGLGPNDRVQAIAVQGDRKIVIGGAFTEMSGLPRNRIARLMYDGSPDPSFNPGSGANDRVAALAIQSDGKLLVGGNFTNFNNIARNRIVRLESNGAVDLIFNPGLGPNGEVLAVAVLTNGQVLIGGLFTEVNGQPRNGLARLHFNGTLDPGFAPPISGVVDAIQVQSNGLIVVGGSFYSSNNIYNVARLTSIGTLDPAFNAFGASGSVRALGLANSNRLVAGGEFFSLNGVPLTRLGRLEGDGAVDLTFTNAGVNGLVATLAVQPDDKIVIGGMFESIGTFPYVGLILRNRLARMNKDGSADLSFGEGEGVEGGSSYIDEYGSISELTAVLATVIEADGKILVGGDFTTINGITRPYIARVFGREASAAIAVHKGQGTVELVWDTGILQVANQITGPWTDLPNAQSPLLYSTGGAQQFFRLKFN